MRKSILVGCGLFVLLGAAIYFVPKRTSHQEPELAVNSDAPAVPKPEPEPDPPDSHRPPCIDGDCQKIRSAVKQRYCLESPFGNGPDDGCDYRAPDKPLNADVLADYHCAFDEKESTSQCLQRGDPPSAIRALLVDQLHQQGLPTDVNDRDLFFIVWGIKQTGLVLAHGIYSHMVGADLEVCEAVVLFDARSQPTVLRQVPFTRTNSDVPEVTSWRLFDVLDIDGDGDVEIVFSGWEYENHWLEVVKLQGTVPQTVFSGLGYYL